MSTGRSKKFYVAEPLRFSGVMAITAGSILLLMWLAPVAWDAMTRAYAMIGPLGCGTVAIIIGFSMFHIGEWIEPFKRSLD